MRPALRFPEFTDEWQLKRLDEIFIERVERGSAGPMLSVTISRGVVPFSSLGRKDNSSVDKSNYKLVKQGDIAYNTMRMWQGASGLVEIDGVISPAYTVLNPKIPGSSKYWTFRFKRADAMHLFQRWSQGLTSDTWNLKFNALGTLHFAVPSQHQEQERITEFLTVIDEKIAALEQKIEKLKVYQQGILRTMLRQQIHVLNNGNTKNVRLAEIAKAEPSTISANQIDGRQGIYVVYGASGPLQTLNSYQHNEAYSAIVKDGAGVGRLIWCLSRSSILGTLVAIKPKADVDARYLYYLLQTIDYAKYTTGSTIPHIYFKDYSREKVSLPSQAIQKKIANFLSAIDERVELTQLQLTRAKEFKKSLIQRMFV